MTQSFLVSSVQCTHEGGTHLMTYQAWGKPENKPLLCVHGLTRNGTDFDDLARYLSERGYYVLCPDMAGRHRSDILPRAQDYNFLQYMDDIITLLKKENITAPFSWVGTSMGGILAMLYGARALGDPELPAIKKLVLNDIGSFISKESLQNLGDNLANAYEYESYEAASAGIRKSYIDNNITGEKSWRNFIDNSLMPAKTGGFKRNYDQKIMQGFLEIPEDGIDLQIFYNQLDMPIFLLRGENSDLLTTDTLETMLKRKGETKAMVIKNTGHAPALQSKKEIEAIAHFLYTQIPEL